MSGPLLVRDSQWVRQAFLLQAGDLDDADYLNRTFSTASLKFTDTTPGGNIVINPLPQFTRYADIRAEGRFSRNKKTNGGKGMGRYYSEAVDDNQQIINMRFGVPQFNSLGTFFSGFYNTGAGQLARTGRSTSAFYTFGKVVGFVVSVTNLPLLTLHLIGLNVRFWLDKPASKFYYLKPTMPLYWNAVTTMVNHIAVNTGVVPRVFGSPEDKFRQGYTFDKEGLSRLHSALPDIFNEGGGINIYALANRAQRLAYRNRKATETMLDGGNIKNYRDLAIKLKQVASATLTDPGPPNYENYLDKYLKNEFFKPDEKESIGDVIVNKASEQAPSALELTKEFWDAEQNDGSAFASFRVNATGTINESFSSATGESELAGTINSMSSKARNSMFNVAGGNLGNNFIANAAESVVSAVKDVITGLGDSMGVSGLATLTGSGFVDIPEHWQSSQASLPRSTYSIQLVSPYGNPISLLTNIYIPLCMLLAGALPLSTGKQSYTSPFLVEIYDRGRCQTRLGIIDSLSVTRGGGNLGFTNEGQVLSIEVSFSVKDLSSILHMPIAENINWSGLAVSAVVGAAVGGAGGAAVAAAAAASSQGAFDEDTVFSDYMATLSGLSLGDQIYQTRKLKLNLTKIMSSWENQISLARLAQFAPESHFFGLYPGRLINALYKGVDK